MKSLGADRRTRACSDCYFGSVGLAALQLHSFNKTIRSVKGFVYFGLNDELHMCKRMVRLVFAMAGCQRYWAYCLYTGPDEGAGWKGGSDQVCAGQGRAPNAQEPPSQAHYWSKPFFSILRMTIRLQIFEAVASPPCTRFPQCLRYCNFTPITPRYCVFLYRSCFSSRHTELPCRRSGAGFYSSAHV